MNLTEIKGIGEKTVPKLNKLGIYSTRDLIDFLPGKYWDMTRFSDLENTRFGDYVLLSGIIVSVTKVQYIRRNMNVFKASYLAQGKKITLTWFNAPYLREKLVAGGEYVVWGKLLENKGVPFLSNPSFEQGSKGERLSGITPIYPTKNIIAQPTMGKFIRGAIEKEEFPSVIESVCDDMPLKQAYLLSHFPYVKEDVISGRRRLNKEKISAQLFSYKILKQGKAPKVKHYGKPLSIIDDAVKALPYSLTASQNKAIEDIVSDFNSGEKMNRLLAGDVGSGKTVVALMAAVYAVRCGYQVAFMAPTEILARQHYSTASKLLEGQNIKIGVLTGVSSTAEKKEVKAAVKAGALNLLIGTHSVIGDKVEFSNLGFIIIDELQRFGVRHKSSLENKSENVDVLVMSATPIPRAMALTLYGDLKLSSLEARGSMADNIATSVVGDADLSEVYDFIHKRIDCGEQAYIVCPLVEDSDGLERISAKSLYASLVSGPFRGVDIGLVYSGMKENLKADVMNRFYSGELKVLVATTVIEVGIDCKSASVMLVLNADCFGLATLHQLRGRVGRREGLKSYCILHTSVKGECERLTSLCESRDGFEIAQKDADMRGYGDFFGMRQSGGGGEWSKIDAKLILECRNIAEKLYKERMNETMRFDIVQKYLETLKDVSLS